MKRPLGRRLLLAAATLVVALLGAEATLRLHDFDFYLNLGADLIGLRLVDLHSFRRAQNRTVVFDRRVFWRYLPDRRHDVPQVNLRPVTINHHGFRGPDFADQKPAGVYRVACLGDSTTFGWSVADDETYPVQLERLLTARWGAGRVEVLNLGVTGYASLQGRELMLGQVKDWAPDLVVFGFGPNDRLPTLASDEELLAQGYWEMSPLEVALRHSQLFILAEAGVKYLERRRQGIDLDPGSWLPRLKRKVSPEEYAANVRAVKAACDRLGAGLVLLDVDYPSAPEDKAGVEIRKLAHEHGSALGPGWRNWDAAGLNQRLSAELGVPVLALRPFFADQLAALEAGRLEPERAAAIRAALPDPIARDPWLYLMIDNGHPNAWGHQLIAAELEGIITGLDQRR